MFSMPANPRNFPLAPANDGRDGDSHPALVKVMGQALGDNPVLLMARRTDNRCC